ncbi:hypothetical protein [Bacillus cereus]|uniref:hypothetical protein n=1 Tax=Bacillus cereus TaxID=1396 RepID=UPI002D787F1E|nr:hypothetical protein [Bacillus cereus]
MSIPKQPYNVSVRFNEHDYKQLLFLHDKFNRMSYGKVSLADVLRIATKELYNIESADLNRPVTQEKSYTPKPKILDSEIQDHKIENVETQEEKQEQEEKEEDETQTKEV